MKSFFSLCKVGNQSQRFGWVPLPVCFPSQNYTAFPRLTDLAAARTLSTFVPRKSHYEVLGLTRSATSAEIRQAFLKLSKECHPDTNKGGPNNHKRFVQVNEAYSVLSKPLSRRDYDTTLDAERYATRHMNATAYRTHTYGFHPEAGHYHHRGHFYHDPNLRNEYGKDEGDRSAHLVNFSVITISITFATVALILHYMHNYIPNPRHSELRRNLSQQEIEQHELIMTSVHEGMKVYYYAVPIDGKSGKYEVLAVGQDQVKNSEVVQELRELNNIKYSKGSGPAV